jgi:hypothetical protein
MTRIKPMNGRTSAGRDALDALLSRLLADALVADLRADDELTEGGTTRVDDAGGHLRNPRVGAREHEERSRIFRQRAT